MGIDDQAVTVRINAMQKLYDNHDPKFEWGYTSRLSDKYGDLLVLVDLQNLSSCHQPWPLNPIRNWS